MCCHNMAKIKTPQSKLRTSKEMSRKELCNWFAFLNSIKFSSIFARNKNIDANQYDIPWNKHLTYIKTISGDLQKYLDEKNGIPFKYSLSLNHEDAKIYTEEPETI